MNKNLILIPLLVVLILVTGMLVNAVDAPTQQTGIANLADAKTAVLETKVKTYNADDPKANKSDNGKGKSSTLSAEGDTDNTINLDTIEDDTDPSEESI